MFFQSGYNSGYIIFAAYSRAKCNSCGICTHECPTNAINDGKINQKCIRCLKCVRTCPQGALEVKYSRVLKRYLKRKKTEETILYT